MYICIIRHGETEWNAQEFIQGHADISLNAKGRFQAELCAKAIEFASWDVIICSTLKRAKETAEIIAKKLDIKKIYENEKLIERDYGKATGITYKEYSEKATIVNWEMESKTKMSIRMRSAIDEIADCFFPLNVLVISHGSAIKSLFSTFQKENEIQLNEKIKNASICLLDFDGKKYNTVFYNQDFKEIRSKLWKNLI